MKVDLDLVGVSWHTPFTRTVPAPHPSPDFCVVVAEVVVAEVVVAEVVVAEVMTGVRLAYCGLFGSK